MGNGQSISQSIISSSGHVSKSEISSINWTLGEAFISSKSSAVSNLREGFHAVISNGDISTSIPAVTTFSSFDVHPNPTTDIINLQLPSTTTAFQTVFIIDEKGTTYKYDYKTKSNVDISDHPAGLYYILLVDEEKRGFVSKVVKL